MSAKELERATFSLDRPDVHRVRPWLPFSHVARELRRLVAGFVEAAAPPSGGTVVDFGSADSPYRDLVAGSSYRAVDLPGNPAADVVVRADGTVPLGDGVADLVLSTQVLEHVADPARYLQECARLLRPGGQLVLTTHGIMFLHPDPNDYWRWTAAGLRLVVERAGFEVLEVRGVLGLVGAALQLLQTGVARRLPRWLVPPVVVVFQLLVTAADRVTSETAKVENGLVLGVRARRPETAAGS